MKVFLSWSGEISRKMALILKERLPNFIQLIDPYISAKDIQAGARWQQDVAKQLQDTDFGIMCITPENTEAPWIHFEAGALSKSIEKGRVCPLLIGLSNQELSSDNPLLQFQTKKFNRTEFYELLQSINNCMESPFPTHIVEESLTAFWPQLEKDCQPTLSELSEHKESSIDNESSVVPSDIMVGEILELVRSQQKMIATISHQISPFAFALKNMPGPTRANEIIKEFLQTCIDVYREEGLQSISLERLENLVAQLADTAERQSTTETLTTPAPPRVPKLRRTRPPRL